MEPHSSGLLSTLVISLVAAFAGGLASRVVNLTPMIGYMFAGVLIGPTFTGFVSDQGIAAELAEIGVALLLFNVGLHFSFKDLKLVRRIAVVGTLSQMAISGALGVFVGLFFFKMSLEAALIMALSFSIASTAISSRTLEEKKQFSTLAGRVAVGWLVVQDLAAVSAMVIFPSFLHREGMDLGAMAASSGKMLLQFAGFTVVMLFGARKYIPRLLGYVAKVGSRELFTLAVIVIALGIAYGASTLFGVSLALGAFFAGVVIGESDLNFHAAAEALSMQQIFSILFFVSVGLLFDPINLVQMPLELFAAWLVIVFGMGFVTFVLLLGMHIPVQTAALIGGTFAQVGELSFILSQMGYKWGALNQNDRDLISGVALVSIILNPMVAKLFTRFGNWLSETKMYLRWQKNGEVAIPEILQPLTGHVILVGRGRVGQKVAEALGKHNIPCITIETDRRLMEKLRRAGTPVIFGDASREPVLVAAHPETAKMLIIATSQQGIQARQTITMAKHLNPSIEVIVRVHEESEARVLNKLGIGLAVMGEREIAVGLSAYALQHYSVEPNAVLETLNVLRQQ